MPRAYTSVSNYFHRAREAREEGRRQGESSGWAKAIKAAASMAEILGDEKIAAAIRELKR